MQNRLLLGKLGADQLEQDTYGTLRILKCSLKIFLTAYIYYVIGFTVIYMIQFH